jgi:hypothetical protein
LCMPGISLRATARRCDVDHSKSPGNDATTAQPPPLSSSSIGTARSAQRRLALILRDAGSSIGNALCDPD